MTANLNKIQEAAGLRNCISYCRVCQASCGVIVQVENGLLGNVRGDPDNPLSRGYICSKGREASAAYHGANRLKGCRAGVGDGSFADIGSNEALDSVGRRLMQILERHGPNSIALFTGTYALFGALTPPAARGWLEGIGSTALYTTGTIDQSAKWIVPLRMGRWEGGWQNFDDADVWLLAGTNPLVSMQGGNTLTGFPAYDPVARLREAKARGLKLIVIDPRATETARYADIHLQPAPGHDAVIFAGFLHIVLAERLFDADFCTRYVEDLDKLCETVAPFTPAMVAARAGLRAEELVHAARMFAQAKHGMAHGGTGPDMGPYSNLAEHLIASLNVICGRYARAGDNVANPGALRKRLPRRESVAPPSRHWDDEKVGRLGGYGTLWGERPTNSLPDAMLSQGSDKIRALIVVGGNPIACWPDQARTKRALAELDLLVVIDPRMTETAEHAHFVIAPTLPYERPDHTRWHETLFPVPFAQYTPALIEPPPGTIDDWRIFFELARRMHSPISISSRTWRPDDPTPDADSLLRELGSEGEISYDALLESPHGRIFDVRQSVEQGEETDTGKFALLPDDVLEEFGAMAIEDDEDGDFPLRIVCRRARWMINSYDARWPSAQRQQASPAAWMNPDDLQKFGLRDGALASVESATGGLTVTVHADPALRPGVLSMPHCQEGASTGKLVDSVRREAINAMPLMSAIPVRIRAVRAGEGESRAGAVSQRVIGEAAR